MQRISDHVVHSPFQSTYSTASALRALESLLKEGRKIIKRQKKRKFVLRFHLETLEATS